MAEVGKDIIGDYKRQAMSLANHGHYESANVVLRLAELQFKQESAVAAVKERAKLEQRTWFLRGSLALNIAVIAGVVVRLVS